MGKRKRLGTKRPPKGLDEVHLRKTAPTKAALPESAQQYIDIELLQYCENAYLSEPLTRKAILKRSHDVVERFMEIRTEDPNVYNLFWDLVERIDLKNRLIDILKNAMIYGVGYLEIVVEDDDADLEDELPMNQIIDLALIDPKTIAPVWDTNPKSPTYGQIAYFYQWVPGMTENLKIHPSRIIMFPFDTLGDGTRFVGIIEPMLQVIAAKIELDKAAGQIPKKVISQIISVNVDKATQSELTAWEKALEKMATAGRFVGSERVKFDVKDTGKALDIKPYSEHLIFQIAGGTGVPYTVLLGAGAGTLSTAEINLRDYYSDLKDLQVRLTPIVKRIFEHELKANGIANAEYEFEWLEIYADEQSEAEILKIKAQAVKDLLEWGVINTDEAREILGLPPREIAEERKEYGTPVRGGKYRGVYHGTG